MIDNNSLSDQLSAQVGTPVTVTRTSQDLREINGRYRIDANVNENPARLWVDCDTGVIYSSLNARSPIASLDDLNEKDPSVINVERGGQYAGRNIINTFHTIRYPNQNR